MKEHEKMRKKTKNDNSPKIFTKILIHVYLLIQK